jgi:hypothetical protein
VLTPEFIAATGPNRNHSNSVERYHTLSRLGKKGRYTTIRVQFHRRRFAWPRGLSPPAPGCRTANLGDRSRATSIRLSLATPKGVESSSPGLPYSATLGDGSPASPTRLSCATPKGLRRDLAGSGARSKLQTINYIGVIVGRGSFSGDSQARRQCGFHFAASTACAVVV